ncbi:MAG: hypothetical protein U0K53_02825 [Paludibacteraceae bacterium]|jgi:hypothetical protein|nr:hypothetical protein [Paludibacteraceae bacterium]
MKKIFYSLFLSMALVACGSMQQTTTPAGSNANAATQTPAATQTTTTAPTTNNANGMEALAGMLGATQQPAQSESYTAGQQSGVALKALYAQYKADGKLDFSNINNLLNIVNLSAQVQKVTKAEEGTVDYTDFGKGLIAGSVNLVNELNQEKVVNVLTQQLSKIDTSKITEAADKAQTTVNTVTESIANVKEASTSVMEIINLFK